MTDSQKFYLNKSEYSLLKTKLDQVAWLWDQLEITRTRQDAVHPESGGSTRRTDQPLPVNLAATNEAIRLRKALESAAQSVCTERKLDYCPVRFTYRTSFVGPLQDNESRVPAGYRETAAGRAQWLSHHVIDMAMCESGPRHFRAILEVVSRAQRTIDLRPEVQFCGLCPECSDVRLYAEPETKYVQCPACSSLFDKKARQSAAERQARSAIGTALELSRVIPTLSDAAIGYSRIRYLIRSKKVLPRPSVDGVDRFVLGEVVDAHKALAESRRNPRGKVSNIA